MTSLLSINSSASGSNATSMFQPPNQIENLTGQRIKVAEHLATVRFDGELPPGSGKIWLGVEWDEPSRGKHSGLHEGIQYFTVKEPNSGSFIRQNALVQTGQTLAQALQLKYSSTSSMGDYSVLDKFGETQVKVEMYGFDKIAKKQKQYSKLEIIGLADMRISKAGELNDLLPLVVDLDLSKSLFANWADIADVCRQLPQLESLRLNFNRINSLHPAMDLSALQSFGQLSKLSLQNTKITWEQMLIMEPYLCNLRELHIGFNGISRLYNPSSKSVIFKNLNMLNLESNNIANWDDISGALSTLPGLEILFLQTNQLKVFNVTEASPKLSNLKSLNVSNNDFETLEEFVKIQTIMPKLDDLKCTGLTHLNLPFSRKLREEIEDFFRTVVISIFPNITSLNSSSVSKKERLNSELFYIKLCGEEMTKRRVSVASASSRKNSVIEVDYEFIRLKDLMNEYEIGEESLNVTLEATTLKENLKTIVFIHNDKRVEKSLPVHTTVRIIKSMISRLFRIPPHAQLITLKSSDTTVNNEDLTETRELRFYIDDDVIEVVVCKR